MTKTRLSLATTILFCLFVSSAFSASYVNLYGDTGINGSQMNHDQKKVDTYSDKDTQCVKWENVCVDKQNCIYRSPLREGCYRCLKPSHFGVHLYPRMESRDTCHYDTAQYLRTMGYTCYVPYESSPCLSEITTQECYMKCVQYQDESDEFQ